MTASQFDPNKVLGSSIIKMGRQELCEFASRLCQRITAEVGTRGRRGGVYPGNISVDDQGNIGIGPSGAGPWEGEELKFVAPELYWNGQCSAASDVYSLGLLLYYSVSGGLLPMEKECEDAQLRRMGGEDLPAPEAAGRRLGGIIEKCLRFKAADRYQTLDELRAVLDSCIKNLYLSGVPSAEAIFKKNDDDLSDVERMMVSIIEKEDPADQRKEDAVLPEEAEEVKVYAPAPGKNEKKGGRTIPADVVAKQIKSAERPAVPKLTEDKNPALRPVTPDRQKMKGQPTQYMKNAERERKINEEVKKRRRRPLAVILVLCALLVVVAIIFNAMLKDFQEAKKIPDNSIAGMTEDPYVGTMAPQSSAGVVPPDDSDDLTVGQVAASASPEPTVTATPKPTGHSYELVKEDVSWVQARDKCVAMGGHLVVINDEAEYNTVIALAENEEGVDKLWIGCHRENDELMWENSQTGYFKWAKGEPTYMDVNDNVAEDYIMLWDNGGWAMNDNRNDPIADYPQWYSGTVAYVCEYGD